MKLLIAEDNPTVQAILKNSVTQWGFQVVCTKNGVDALNILTKQDGPQLALIDWMMPEMDGLTLCKKIRQLQGHKPFYLVILTSNSQQNDIIQGLNAGADDYITKPFNKNELQSRVNVGRRMISMMNNQCENDRLQGALDMARTICHEMNQPLQVITGFSELLTSKMSEGDQHYKEIKQIQQSALRIGGLNRKIMNVSRCCYKNYLNGQHQIFDLTDQEDA